MSRGRRAATAQAAEERSAVIRPCAAESAWSPAMKADLQAQIDALREIVEMQGRELSAHGARLELLEIDSLTEEEVADLKRILPAIAAAKGSDGFTSGQAVKLEAPGVQLVLHGFSPARLGRLFARARGQDFAGYTIERIGIEHQAAIWRITQVVRR